MSKPLRLTGEQRATFYAGGFPKLTGKSPCPIRVGELIEVSSRVTFKVQAVRWPKPGEWKLEYLVLDNRDDADRYLAARYGVAIDEKGQPKPHTKNEELGYTNNPKGALEPGVPSVSDRVQRKITADSHRVAGLVRAEEQDRREARSLANRIRQAKATARQKGVDISPEVGRLQDELDRIERRLADAA